jgi:MSHA pilin protein MshD
MSLKSTTRIRHRRARGITLLEVLIASVLVGFLLVAAMRALPGVLQTRTIAARRCDAACLAQQLLSEILQSAYEDPQQPGSPLGLDASESPGHRTDWDDVDDCDGYAESPPEDKAGNELTQYTGWTREAWVEYLDPGDPQTTSPADQGLKRILVRVTSPDGEQTDLWALRSRAGVLEQPPASGEITVVSWVGCRLQAGSAPDAVVGGTHVLNHAEGP